MKTHFLAILSFTLLFITNSFGQFSVTPTAPNTNSLTTNGSIGIGTGTSWQAAKLHIFSTSNQLRLANGSYFSDINTTVGGHLVFQPSFTGGRIGFGTANPTDGFHSNMGIFKISDPASTTRGVQVSPNITASIGDAPLGALIISTIQTNGEGISYAPGFLPGIKMGAYAFNDPLVSGGVMKSMWETTNTSGGVNPNLLLVKNGGNVGIGTGVTAPSKLLTVNGDAFFNGRADINSAIKTDKYFVINDVSVPASPVETFAVSGNGYTKINVTNPAAMDNVLDVIDVSVIPSLQVFRVKSNGHVFAREVEIRNTSMPFPDYVFTKGYNLMPLSEVEKYIDANKHLPGFEKGTYYEENGIKSSEMFIKQQEKIEELTLYIIELEKRMKAIENSSKH